AQAMGADAREVEAGVLHVTGGDVTPAALVARLAGGGVEVDEIVAEAPTLEEMFMSLVSGDRDRPEAAA
ncbi:MAG: hypothetical protein K8M05_33755, partial [Deltaproteobacteria bacterium]|nr:hypothetical protein [Kofleriaceae bacterium]